MAKRKSTNEMMAERNPLNRPVIKPLDIYHQRAAESGQIEADAKGAEKSIGSDLPEATDTIRPYSTHLRQSQIKGIKLRAVEGDTKDQQILQAAVDEYFLNHPL